MCGARPRINSCAAFRIERGNGPSFRTESRLAPESQKRPGGSKNFAQNREGAALARRAIMEKICRSPWTFAALVYGILGYAFLLS
jgi:hypothetical protein